MTHTRESESVRRYVRADSGPADYITSLEVTATKLGADCCGSDCCSPPPNEGSGKP